jgi:hypothetical protein
MLSSVSSKIPQETKDYLSNAQKELFNREHLRSVSVFFGIGEERPFYIEKVPSLIMERLRHNIAFFYLNYMLLTAVLFVLTLLISPSAIIGIGLLALAWMYVIKTSQSGAMTIYSTLSCHDAHETVGTMFANYCVFVFRTVHFAKARHDCHGTVKCRGLALFAQQRLLVHLILEWIPLGHSRVAA